MSETIVSLSTAKVRSALAIIRLSGDNCFNIVNNLIKKNLNELAPNTAIYSKIYFNNNLLDEVVLIKYNSPKSFTGENMVEITCHGGILIVNNIINALLSFGARYALPGEYTKRAFLNKKMSLLQAEAINDIINSKNIKSLNKSLSALNSENVTPIIDLKAKLSYLISKIEVHIEYPEIPDYDFLISELDKPIIEIKELLIRIIDNTNKTILTKNGIKVAIIGLPNVGKSSLLNALINENKAIVTSIPGTTRDVVEGYINYKDYSFIFYDTAGIRQTDNEIELIGIKKTIDTLDSADIVLLVLDGTNSSSENKELLDLTNKYNRVIVSNKADLITNNNNDYLKVSALKKEGLAKLLDLLIENLNLNDFNDDNYYLSNQRQLSLIVEALNSINSISKNDFMEIISEKLNYSLKKILSILGDDYVDTLLDSIFSNFCVGK